MPDPPAVGCSAKRCERILHRSGRGGVGQPAPGVPCPAQARACRAARDAAGLHDMVLNERSGFDRLYLSPMKSLSGQPSPSRDAEAAAPRREADGGWTQPPVVTRSATAFCCLEPRRGEMSVAPEPPHLLSFCFSAAWGHPRPKVAQPFLPARGETARAAPPKNKGGNPGTGAFYKHAAPLGPAVGCASALPKRSRPAVWPSGFGCDSGPGFGKRFSAQGTPRARQRVEFRYDTQGRRVEKVMYAWDPQQWTYVPQSTNRFVYDGWNLAVTLASDLGPLASFTWGTDLSGTLQGAGGVGGLLSVTVHTGPNTGAYFCCYDGNGNVMELINAADGSVAARYEYGPFGELLRATGPLAKTNPFRFSTKYQDEESDLLYYGVRYEKDGRWLSRDPIGEWGGAHLYGFVREDAINFVDLLGFQDKGPIPNPVIPPNWPTPDPGQPPLPPPNIPPGGPPGTPTSGSPTQPPPGVPPSAPPRNPPGSGPPTNPGSAAGGAISLCANMWNDIFNRWEFQDGIKICRSQMGSQGTGEKCCVMLFCRSQCCVSGRIQIQRVMAYLDSKPCSASKTEFETPGKVWKPGCSNRNDVQVPWYETMFKLSGGYGDQ